MVLTCGPGSSLPTGTLPVTLNPPAETANLGSTQFPPRRLSEWPEGRKPLTLTSPDSCHLLLPLPPLPLWISGAFLVSDSVYCFFQPSVSPFSLQNLPDQDSQRRDGEETPRRQRWGGKAEPKEGSHIIYNSPRKILRGVWGLLIITLGQLDVNHGTMVS